MTLSFFLRTGDLSIIFHSSQDCPGRLCGMCVAHAHTLNVANLSIYCDFLADVGQASEERKPCFNSLRGPMWTGCVCVLTQPEARTEPVVLG